MTALAKRTLQLYFGVAKFGTAPSGAAIDLAIDYHPHADAMFNGDDNEIIAVAPGSEQMFSLGHKACVIVDEHRAGQQLLERVSEMSVPLFKR